MGSPLLQQWRYHSLALSYHIYLLLALIYHWCFLLADAWIIGPVTSMNPVADRLPFMSLGAMSFMWPFLWFPPSWGSSPVAEGLGGPDQGHFKGNLCQNFVKVINKFFWVCLKHDKCTACLMYNVMFVCYDVRIKVLGFGVLWGICEGRSFVVVVLVVIFIACCEQRGVGIRVDRG